jgi:glyoxylase-like metal-dependent hydrolase (beta-lactamase superfamily II)
LHDSTRCFNLDPCPRDDDAARREAEKVMKLGEPVDKRLPWVRKLHNLDEARAVGTPAPRVQALRKAGRALGDALRTQPKVIGVKTMDVAPLPYPTRFAFNGTVPRPWPMVLMLHRCLLVQLETESGPKNVLFNPTDPDASSQTPFFVKLRSRIERVAPFADRLLTRGFRSIEEQLDGVGLSPADIDVIAFDHFHTQDLRPMLGDGGQAARFPNALLLAPKREWEDWGGLHPMQQAWFIAEGRRGVPQDRVVLTDHDLVLGSSCALLQTPGHTSGNQTLFVHADEGVFGCCENGCSADSWTPGASAIPGLRRFADFYEVEVVLNANTPELGGEQYISMVLEKSVVDRARGNPAFVQMFPSSEVSPSPLAPGLRPSMIYKDRDSGVFAKRV